MEHALNDRAGSVHLIVGNQSFDVDPVGIEVMVDGDVVAAGDFSVGGEQPPQHNWTRYELDLAPGPHVLVASSAHDGTRAEVTIDVPGVRTVRVAYWSANGQGAFTVDAGDAPPASM